MEESNNNNQTQWDNATSFDDEGPLLFNESSEYPEIPFMSDATELELYLRVTCLIFLFIIFTIGTIGNAMVTLVIGCSRDMRTSTNIFLVNLSIADLLVLLVCTPTALIEVTHHHQRWILGYYLCKFVPILEATVANTSVLTILAISFERYYAICRPLRANYICTKSRAVYISAGAWIVATLITSPTILMIEYNEGINERGEWTARCDVNAGTLWPDIYTISTIILLFILPFFILLVTYTMIAHRLSVDVDCVTSNCNVKHENYKTRKQVVVMLGSVCITFFICFLPFRILTIFAMFATLKEEHMEAFNNFHYFARIMVYFNSCLNPILYNVMSSKFRNGFLRLCNRHRKPSSFTRQGTFLTNTTNSTTVSINLNAQNHVRNGSCKATGHNNSLDLNGAISRKSTIVRGVEGKTLKNLLSQSHGSNGFTMSQRTPAGTLYSGTNGFPFQEGPSTNSSSAFLKTGKHDALNKNGYVNLSTGIVKSDVIYSAYIPGTRSETVL